MPDTKTDRIIAAGSSAKNKILEEENLQSRQINGLIEEASRQVNARAANVIGQTIKIEEASKEDYFKTLAELISAILLTPQNAGALVALALVRINSEALIQTGEISALAIEALIEGAGKQLIQIGEVFAVSQLKVAQILTQLGIEVAGILIDP
ncbi:hypothetical protein [Candidatus Formimonas warabiya]|uniref:Uncharacterized protein n=1 Tax=Formimonas warabiya TaxID=1761012 RepID=A0A3G1KQH4_FORW1|nr:hypothetical protein [Candidatus Formimonas warabiya]ATW24719.1 hypothetical protein DCMF_07965 [Candidatus Formimonas warabiya]